MVIETKYLDQVTDICLDTDLLSVMTWQSYIKTYYKAVPFASWDKYFRDTQPQLYLDAHRNPLVTQFADEVALNMFKVSQNKDDNEQRQFKAHLQDKY